MENVKGARNRVFGFFYQKRIDEPNTFFSRKDMEHLAEPALLDAALRFGREMGYLKLHRKHYQLTATGMLFVESNGDEGA